MLGVGWTEMLVIGVVALIFIGPKDLPVVMRRVGQFAGMIRRMGGEFQRELNKTTGLDEVRSLRNSITAPLRQTTEEIRREFNAIGKDGTVQPSGAIKPADPKAQSVVDEIKAQAGMAPAVPPAPLAEPEEPAKPAAAPAAKKAPVKASRPAKATPVPDSKVVASSLEDVSPKAQPATIAPAEPVKKAATRKPRAAAKPVAEAGASEPAKTPAKPRVRKTKPTIAPQGDADKA